MSYIWGANNKKHYYVFRAYFCVHYCRWSARFVSAFALHVQNLDVIYKRHHHPAKTNEKALWFLNNPYYRNERLWFALFILIWIALFFCSQSRRLFHSSLFLTVMFFLLASLLEVYRAYCPLELSDLLISLFSDWIQAPEQRFQNCAVGIEMEKACWFPNNGRVIFLTQNRARSRYHRPNIFVFFYFALFS